MLRSLKKGRVKGFASIVEVAVTSVIFILATAGILSTVSMLKPQSQVSSQKVEAAYIGKGVLDALRKEVHATSTGFFGANLAVGTHTWPSVGEYNITYTVTSPNPNIRQVNMSVSWPD